MDDLVPAIIANAADRGSLSDELHFAAATPAERHHLDHGRANALRALEIPPAASVVEIGAEYGALTRYLGERAGTVHAVEPDPARAEVVRIRTAGLDGVRVDAEPPGGEPDLVVVPEVSATPTRLRAARTRVVVAFAGDLPGRRAVEAALRAADLPLVTVLTCVPDPWITRALYTDELVGQHPRLAASLGSSHRPGFVLLAGPDAQDLWPADRLACYFNTAERAAVWCTRADVVRTGTRAEVRHAPLLPDPRPVHGIRVRACTDVVYDAPSMLTVLLEQPWRATELLTGWRELVRAQAPSVGPALWDLVPHNVLVDGPRLRPIDLEWEHRRAGEREVIERGLLILAHYLAGAGWSGAAEGGSVRELAGWLGVLLGLHPSYVDDAVAREVEFGVIGVCGARRGTAEIRAAIRDIWEQRLEQRITRYGSLGVGGNRDEVPTR